MNEPTDLGNTPAHIAATFGQMEIMVLLIFSKADMNRVNANNETPLDSAIKNGMKEVEKLLRDNGAVVATNWV